MKDKRDNQMRPNTSGTCRRIPESRRFEEKKEDRHVEQEVVATERKDSVFNAYRDILSNFTSNTLTPLVHRVSNNKFDSQMTAFYKKTHNIAIVSHFRTNPRKRKSNDRDHHHLLDTGDTIHITTIQLMIQSVHQNYHHH